MRGDAQEQDSGGGKVYTTNTSTAMDTRGLVMGVLSGAGLEMRWTAVAGGRHL